MRKNLSLLSMLMCMSAIVFAQQDTLIYDTTTGNYLMRYLRENPLTGGRDSLVSVVFVPATKIVPNIRASVTFDADSNLFLYRYSIQNGPESQQNLIVFKVRFGDGADVKEKSTLRWRGGRNRGFKERELNQIWSWHADQGLEPGWGTGGFILGSTGLPGIGCAYFQGNAPIAGYKEGLPPYELLKQIAGLQSFPADHVLRKSIVPIALNSGSGVNAFTDTISSYALQSRVLGWITSQAVADKYMGYFATAKSQLQSNNIAGARSTLQTVLQDANVDSSSALTSEAYALIRYNTEYLLAQLPAPPPPGLIVKLVNSTGTKLTSGSLQYFDGSWKDATNNNDGTFSIITSLNTLSLRMTYEFATQTKSNVTVGFDTVAFQTVNTQVKLQNSQGAPIDTGTVQYYHSAWKTLGTTTSGIASKELLPGSYTFRMTYASATIDKQQDIGANPAVVFQTVNASVQLKNSQGALMDQGTVQYYFSSWKNFGVTTGGVATKELLPGNYTFRMTYAAATNDKQQNIGSNATVVFQTVSAAVQLKNSQGSFIDQGTVQYYFSSWNNFGTTTGGLAVKELLPRNYTFRMTYESVPNDKVQNLSTNSTVSFSTVLCTVSVKNSQSQPVNNALISYYSSVWKQIGPTVNGQVTKELLPSNLTFRMTLGTASQDKAQNIGTNGVVEFVTQ